MNIYNDLLKILDNLRTEAPPLYRRYHPDDSNQEQLCNARARAFIHLFLKVKFGIIDFLDRENFITDDSGDGGIDGYFIDEDKKILYFIQSKFRNTLANFENKEITFDELLSMDIKRVSEGETCYENGVPYNDKILKLIKELQNISDLPKYKHKVILLANVKQSLQPKLVRLTGGYKVDIYNYERCYSELVFPLVSGSYYDISELKITINVDRNSAGHRIQYYPKTKYYECTVNALFVPTLEIAKILSKYKNSILKFNPRSYLDLAAGSVNAQIAKSITDIPTNEFALFNNGITMLSDDTIYSDKVGKKNKAEIIVTNPQIINGGQTAYTLSVLYDNCVKNNTLHIFEEKEVLLKIISFNEDLPQDSINGNKLKLIEDISIATNQQSPVTEADRRANDKVQIELQKVIFEEFGLYYERKRGEFGDGIRQGYIDRAKILDREQFLRICLSAQNNPALSRSGTISNFFIKTTFDKILPDTADFRKYIFAYKTYEKISQFSNPSTNISNLARHAITCVVANRFHEEMSSSSFDQEISKQLTELSNIWSDFESFVRNQPNNKNKFFREIFDKATGDKIIETNWSGYYKGGTLINDLREFFKF